MGVLIIFIFGLQVKVKLVIWVFLLSLLFQPLTTKLYIPRQCLKGALGSILIFMFFQDISRHAKLIPNKNINVGTDWKNKCVSLIDSRLRLLPVLPLS